MDYSRIKFFADKKSYGNFFVVMQEEELKEFTKRLKVTLSKHSSSAKTRLLSKIISNNNVIKLAFFGSKSVNEFFMFAPVHKEGIPFKIVINCEHIDASYGSKSLVALYSEIMTLEKDIKRESMLLSDARMKSVENMKNQRKNLMKDFLENIDYFALLDTVYFAALGVLAERILIDEKNLGSKVLTIFSDIIAKFLMKIWYQYHAGDENEITPEIRQLIDAASIYFVRVYYFKESGLSILKLLDRKSIFKFDVLETLKNAKINSFKEFKEFAVLLDRLNLFEITPNAFELLWIKTLSERVYRYYFRDSLARAITTVAFISKPNRIIEKNEIIDSELQGRLEELLLNEQRNIRWKTL